MSDEKEPKVGLTMKRKCRDVIFLILFILYWVGMIIVAHTGVSNGDIRQIPKDYLGNFCGLDNPSLKNSYRNQTGKAVLYYLDPFDLTSENATYICLNKCPNVTKITTGPDSICAYGITPTSLTLPEHVSSGKCSPYQYNSQPVLNRCIPLEPIPSSMVSQTVSVGNTTISLDLLLNQGKDTAIQAVADLYVTWPIFAVGAATAIVISFFWLFLAQYVVGMFVWISMIAINLIAVFSSILLYLYWNSRKVAFANGTLPSGIATANTPWGNFTQEISFFASKSTVTQNEVNISFGVFITSCVCTVILLLVTIAMIKRIRLAIQIINETSKAFVKMPGIIIMPIFFAVFMVALFGYFIVIMLYLVTPVGPTTISIIGKTFSDPNASRIMVWYHLAGFIWSYYTAIGISHCIVAGAIAQWYWTMDKKAKFTHPVLSSAYRVFRYHLGSIILGSVLITIVELLRILLYQLQKKVAKSQVPWLKYVVACAQCCMKMVQVLMKFVNKNAYIYIAITGKPFFKSAGAATALLLRNAAKTVAVTYVADVALFLSKLIVVGINCLIAHFVLLQNPNLFPSNSYPSLTIGLLGLETFLIACVFFGNYQLAIDTIFLSVLEDMEKNDGSPARPYHMSDNMKDILSKKNQTPKVKANEIKQL